jgi:hypothetical protein
VNPKDDQWRSPERELLDHAEWWADRVYRLMLGAVRRAKGYKVGPTKEPWDRDKFLRRISHLPGSEELAAAFQETYDEAHGNPERFLKNLRRRVGI